MDGEANNTYMAAPRVPQRISYAPCPTEHPPFPNGYMGVAYDWHNEPPWPGQVNYVLDREASDLRPHSVYEEMEEGTAVYVLEDDP